jgi:hypothetical protein
LPSRAAWMLARLQPVDRSTQSLLMMQNSRRLNQAMQFTVETSESGHKNSLKRASSKEYNTIVTSADWLHQHTLHGELQDGRLRPSLWDHPCRVLMVGLLRRSPTALGARSSIYA